MATEEMCDLIGRHATEDGIHQTPLSQIALARSSAPTAPRYGLYNPALCIVAQGRKRAMLGQQAYLYDPAHYLVVSVDLPVVGHIVEASVERPYLSFKIDLDVAVLADLMLDQRAASDSKQRAMPGLAVSALGPGLLDAAVRLLRLLDSPDDAPVLAPLIEREILYRLLIGEQGAMVRHIATAESRLSQISRAIGWIKRNYAAPFSVDAVAAEAGMSASSFHHHFKAVTAMSPLQYRTQLRLQEARRLMIAEALDAAAAGFRVGYESPSQFSRDYRRAFGEPPLRDVARLRATPDLAMVA